jgi:hypothetical protein
MAELDAEEAKLVEAEEEELWMLTLQQQARHIAQHIEFDLPQAVVAHMDPLLYKKLDWELTNGQDLMHHEAVQAADCEQVCSRAGQQLVAAGGCMPLTCLLGLHNTCMHCRAQFSTALVLHNCSQVPERSCCSVVAAAG